MQLSDVYLRMGEDQCRELMRTISLGRLKTYQLFDRFKARLHVNKLNSETLRKSAPRVWAPPGTFSRCLGTRRADRVQRTRG